MRIDDKSEWYQIERERIITESLCLKYHIVIEKALEAIREKYQVLKKIIMKKQYIRSGRKFVFGAIEWPASNYKGDVITLQEKYRKVIELNISRHSREAIIAWTILQKEHPDYSKTYQLKYDINVLEEQEKNSLGRLEYFLKNEGIKISENIITYALYPV